MSTLLHNLDKQAILLMYLAGELPAEDRGEVEQMLAGDSQLRAEFDQLRGAHGEIELALRTADEAERLALPAGTAARRVGQAVRSWHAWRLTQPPAEPQRMRRRFPAWAYPIAAAVVLVVGYVGWWGLQPDRPMMLKAPNTMPSESELADADNAAHAAPGDATASTPEDALASGGPWGRWIAVLRDPADDALDEAEEELYALSQTSTSSTLTDDASSILLMGETDER
jgi:anti-sigma factor RsiW